MPQPIHQAYSIGSGVSVDGVVKSVYVENAIGSLIPVDFTQVELTTVLLHSEPFSAVYVKYFKKQPTEVSF